MLEVTDSQLSQYVLHYVGDGTILTDEVYERPQLEMEAALTQLAFGKIELEQAYEFFHETSLDHNEIYNYVQAIFAERRNFLTQSKHIATHLAASSNHPGIKDGELFIGLFDNCLWNNQPKTVLSIVKVEDKELFLDVKSEDGKLAMNGVDGINVKRAYNSVVIVDMGAEEKPAVFIKTKKKEDVLYWQERFLKVKVSDESYYNTNQALIQCKKFILKEEAFSNPQKLEYLNKTLEFFRQEDEFAVDDYIEQVFERVEDVQKDILTQTIKPYETIISESAIAKVEKTYKRKIKLDDRVEIQVSVQDAEEISRIIEVGYDEVTKRKFYKIYFDEEQ
ncbi:MAG: nucleoid-associated protein [Solibacillus sp.]